MKPCKTEAATDANTSDMKHPDNSISKYPNVSMSKIIAEFGHFRVI
jgi:hypothetical protein